MQLYGQGRWSAGEDLSQGIDLKITGGIVSGNATGVGKLILRDDKKSIAKLTISAAAADGNTIKVEFTAEQQRNQQMGGLRGVIRSSDQRPANAKLRSL